MCIIFPKVKYKDVQSYVECVGGEILEKAVGISDLARSREN